MVSMSKNVIKIHWRHDIDEKIKIQSAMWFRRNEQNTSATWFRRKYRLWQPWRNKIDLEVLGLSLFPSPDIDNWMEVNPEQQVVTTMQVHQGDQPRLPPSCIASLACVCMMAACPLHKQKNEQTSKFYISTDASHTHTRVAQQSTCIEKVWQRSRRNLYRTSAASGAGRANLVIAWESHGVVLDPHRRQCSTNASASFYSTNASDCFETLAWWWYDLSCAEELTAAKEQCAGFQDAM